MRPFVLLGGDIVVTIKDIDLKNAIMQGIERAVEFSKPIIVSEVKKINRIDPLSFFEANNGQYVGSRFFWKDSSNEMYLVGLGISKQIKSDQVTDRFFHVEKEWSHLLEHRILISENENEGLGPIIFGGFSFDPYKKKTSLWSKFGQTQFHIPTFLLTIMNGEYFLTTNIVCTEHDSLEKMLSILNEREKILSTEEQIHLSPPVTILEEIEINPQKWKETIRGLVKDLETDQLQKVVLARELRLKFDRPLSTSTIIQRLLIEQKDSYVFAFESGKDCFVGASPERLVKKQGDELLSASVAGSIARGETVEEDHLLGETLLNDKKNIIEHQFVVQMIREAMEKVCDTVEIPSSPILMKMRDIQHLYTPVVGTINAQSTLLQVVELLHPTPALGGFPKEAALKKIREVEELDRGFYAGPIGWIDANRNGEFAVAIRSALIQENEASLFAGCGIVKDSNPESEYVETKIKFRPMLSALRGDKE